MIDLLAVAAFVVLPASEPTLPAGDPEPPVQEREVYRALNLRAAPGRLLELIELLREERSLAARTGDAPSLWMRHSQGDHWDLMLLYPMGGSMGAWYADGRVRARAEARTDAGRTGRALRAAIDDATAWREETFVWGPPAGVVRERWADAGLFHVEMFVAFPGKREELLRQRRMENDYLERIGLAPNLVFVREAGGPTDVFTLGFYRDLRHYAEGSTVSDEERERAARAAGFEGAAYIGTYLRELIAGHHDTLAVRIP